MRKSALFAGIIAMLLVAAPAVAQDKEGDAPDEKAEKSAEAAPEEAEGEKAEAEADDTKAEADDSGMAESTEEEPAGDTSDDESMMMAEESDDSAEEETDTGGKTKSSDWSGHASTSNFFVAAPHVGVTVPSLFSDLGAWGIFGLELGFQPGIDGRPLEIAVIGRYTQPGADGSGTDANLGEGGSGADYSWELTQRTLTLDLVGIYRFRNVSPKLHPYGLLGPRVNLMETVMTASGNNADFGEVRETNTEFGFVVGGGVDYQLGPGTLFSELKFGWSNVKQELTGNANAGALVLDVGYRFYPF